MTIVEKLRALADFFELHTELAKLYRQNEYMMLNTKEEALLAAKIPGAKKEYDDTSLFVDIPVSNDFHLRCFITRKEVCTAVKTENVDVAAREAYTYEKVVEWKCHPLLEE